MLGGAGSTAGRPVGPISAFRLNLPRGAADISGNLATRRGGDHTDVGRTPGRERSSMGIVRRWLARGTAGLGVGAVALTGCQTYPAGAGGMTLPSPHYLEHYPQYIPPDPPF